MARNKSKSTQAKIALTRLVEDEQVQKQLRTGALRLREAYTRASRRPASKAVEDKKVYSKVQEAASAFASAGRRLRPKPEPKKTGRKLALGVIAAGLAAFAVKKKRSSAETPAPQFTEPTIVPPPTPTSGAPATTVSAA